MGEKRLGIVMNGVTGRMGINQHLIRSVAAIRSQGGVTLKNGDRVMPDPILVGRNEEKIAALAKAHGVARCTTDLDKALADKNDTVFFDAATTQMRPPSCAKAIDAGKHIYCEKPVATTLEEALGSRATPRPPASSTASCRTSCSCPACANSRRLIDSGFFGRILTRARRIRLLGVRGRPAAGAAPVVELPQRGRRRHHPRHVLPLALRARQHLRQREVGRPVSAPPTSPSASTRAASATRSPPTTRPTPPSGSTATSSRTSTARGRRASVATTCSRFMSMARTAPPSPVCRTWSPSIA